MNYKPPYTITTKILAFVSEIVELITEIKYIEKGTISPKLRKKNQIKWRTILSLRSYNQQNQLGTRKGNGVSGFHRIFVKLIIILTAFPETFKKCMS